MAVMCCRFSGSKAMLSGPAGGVVGYAMTSYDKHIGKPVIGFDMGGKCLVSFPLHTYTCTCTLITFNHSL